MALIIPNSNSFDPAQVRRALMALVDSTKGNFNIHQLHGRGAKDSPQRLTAIPKRVTYKEPHTFYEIQFICHAQSQLQEGDIFVIGASGDNIVMAFDIRPDLFGPENAYTAKTTIDLMDETISHSYEAYQARALFLQGEKDRALITASKVFSRLEAMMTSIFGNAAKDVKPVNELLTIVDTAKTPHIDFEFPQSQLPEENGGRTWALHVAMDSQGRRVLLHKPKSNDSWRLFGLYNEKAVGREYAVSGRELQLEGDHTIDESKNIKGWGPFQRIIFAENVSLIM